MKAALLLLLCVVVATLGGCRSKQERSFRGQVLAGEQSALVELAAGALASVSITDGSVEWRYQPTTTPSPYIDFAEQYRLVCPVVPTPANDLLLRYDAELHVISRAEGELRWKQRVYRWASGKRRCPAAAPDGGVLLLGQSGLLVQKLNRDGSPGWEYDLTPVGAALSAPEVSARSGDVLIQTASHLVNLSPAGTLNWARPRVELGASE